MKRYTVMLRCWNANPELRPTFEELSDELHRMLTQETDYLTPDDFKGEPSYINTSKENISSA
ncbi:fibroblast growth factor receptor 2-like [Oculina patagonica]